jgi:hypothetical protein
MCRVTEISPASGGESYAFGINSQGDAAGTAVDDRGVWTAFVYLRAENQMILLASPGGGASVAYDLNDLEPTRFPQVVGYATTPSGPARIPMEQVFHPEFVRLSGLALGQALEPVPVATGLEAAGAVTSTYHSWSAAGRRLVTTRSLIRTQ